MQKIKRYPNTYFSAKHLKEIKDTFLKHIGVDAEKNQFIYNTEISEIKTNHDHESEFFHDINNGVLGYMFYEKYGNGEFFQIDYFNCSTKLMTVKVNLPERHMVDSVLAVADQLAGEAKLPEKKEPTEPENEPKPVSIFIGHGRDEQWRDLKDHLKDQHNLNVVAYEVGSRSGHTIRDILDDMLSSSSMAFLVMTGEDETPEGGFRARQNVVHEAGLFQGKLGFSKGIVLLEEGVERFSNLDGIQYIPFAEGNIRETFGDVLAVIRREFPDALNG